MNIPCYLKLTDIIIEMAQDIEKSLKIDKRYYFVIKMKL